MGKGDGEEGVRVGLWTESDRMVEMGLGLILSL